MVRGSQDRSELLTCTYQPQVYQKQGMSMSSSTYAILIQDTVPDVVMRYSRLADRTIIAEVSCQAINYHAPEAKTFNGLSQFSLQHHQ